MPGPHTTHRWCAGWKQLRSGITETLIILLTPFHFQSIATESILILQGKKLTLCSVNVLILPELALLLAVFKGTENLPFLSSYWKVWGYNGSIYPTSALPGLIRSPVQGTVDLPPCLLPPGIWELQVWFCCHCNLQGICCCCFLVVLHPSFRRHQPLPMTRLQFTLHGEFFPWKCP